MRTEVISDDGANVSSKTIVRWDYKPVLCS